MKGNIHKKINLAILAVFIIVITIMVIGAADGNPPGSQTDPIVTQSYVEQAKEQLKYYIDTFVTKINGDVAAANTNITKQNDLITKLKADVDLKTQQIAKLQQDNKALQDALAKVSSPNKLTVVELKKGATLIPDEGTELIVRAGKLTAVSGKLGSLCDLTLGRDLKAGEALVLNHSLIALKNDGRGLKAATDKAVVVVKGPYTIK